MLYEVVLLVFLYIAFICAAKTPDPKEAITIARCRSGCLRQYRDDFTCEGEDCPMCWQLCQLLALDAFSWTPLCTLEQRRLCTPGCRTACDAMMDPWPQQTRLKAIFSTAPDVTTTTKGESRISWDIPTLRFASEVDEETTPWFVYVLYKRYSGDTSWQTEIITREQSVVLTSQPYMQLHLLAVTSSGVMAECYPGQRYDNVAWTTIMTPNDVTSYVMPAPEITMDTASRVLQVNLIWTFNGSHVPETVIIQWSRLSCQRAVDSCQLPDQDLYVSLRPSVGKTVVTLPGVTYNSEYRLEVFRMSFDPEHVLYFHTTWCHLPDQTLTLCRDEGATHGLVDYESGYRCVLGLCCCMILMCVVLVVCILRRYIAIREDMENLMRSSTSAVPGFRADGRGSVVVRHRAGYCRGQVTDV